MAAGECAQLCPSFPFLGEWADKQAAYGATNCFITQNGKCRRGNQAALLQIASCRNVFLLPDDVLNCDNWKPAAHHSGPPALFRSIWRHNDDCDNRLLSLLAGWAHFWNSVSHWTHIIKSVQVGAWPDWVTVLGVGGPKMCWSMCWLGARRGLRPYGCLLQGPHSWWEGPLPPGVWPLDRVALAPS